MRLEPVVRRSASQGAFDQLIGHLLDGGIGPGDSLPAERTLTEILGVNRQAVREALQRLSQAGLVQISQGEPTRALDYRNNGGLDLLPRLLVAPDGPNVEVGRAVMEMRACIGPDVARRAAERATTDQSNGIVAAAAQMHGAREVEILVDLDLEFWERLVDASDNIAYRLAYNSLRSAYQPLAEILGPVLLDELSDAAGHDRIAEAVRTGDPARAATTATELLSKGTRAITSFLSELDRDLKEDR